MDLKNTMQIIDEIKSKEVAIPITYKKAIVAIQECNKIDEAKEWTDKMSALALYYKQSRDETLIKYAKRIQYRAKRRMGELLKQYDGRGGNHGNQYQSAKSVPEDTFANSVNNVASSIGLSSKQKVEAVRFANVPINKFEEIVESENIPTQKEVAELGTKKIGKSKKVNYKANSIFQSINDLLKEMNKVDPIYVCENIDPDYKEQMISNIKQIENWFDNYIINVK
jgi:hypothetical protein